MENYQLLLLALLLLLLFFFFVNMSRQVIDQHQPSFYATFCTLMYQSALIISRIFGVRIYRVVCTNVINLWVDFRWLLDDAAYRKTYILKWKVVLVNAVSSRQFRVKVFEVFHDKGSHSPGEVLEGRFFLLLGLFQEP